MKLNFPHGSYRSFVVLVFVVKTVSVGVVEAFPS